MTAAPEPPSEVLGPGTFRFSSGTLSSCFRLVTSWSSSNGSSQNSSFTSRTGLKTSGQPGNHLQTGGQEARRLTTNLFRNCREPSRSTLEMSTKSPIMPSSEAGTSW